MKKGLFVFFTFIFTFFMSVDAEVINVNNYPDIFQIISFKSGEPNANKILFEYINQDMADIVKFANIKINDVAAYKTDLNNDGTKEIIGIVRSTVFCSKAGINLFILQKINKRYKNISIIFADFDYKIHILKNKTNGFYDIKVNNNKYLKCHVGKYQNSMYQYDCNY